jgi:hypothetical protein
MAPTKTETGFYLSEVIGKEYSYEWLVAGWAGPREKGTSETMDGFSRLSGKDAIESEFCSLPELQARGSLTVRMPLDGTIVHLWATPIGQKA